MTDDRYILQSSLLSPFSMKARLLCRAFEVPTRYTPESGGVLDAARIELSMQGAKRGWGRSLHRSPSDLEEFPLVPWLFPPTGGFLCDSTEIGLYLERTIDTGDRTLTPTDPATAYVVRLIEEAVDEVGLYALHHMRWVVSARTNGAMAALTDEIAGSLGRVPARLFTSQFGPRQVRRLAYLFSVAPEGDARFGDLPKAMRPPSRPGFPPTHALIEAMWERLIDAVDEALGEDRAFLFGAGLTLADASIIGNLGSTLRLDPEAAQRLEDRAPRTARWVREHLDGPLQLSATHEASSVHRSLVAWAEDCFLPLMRQNAAAHAGRTDEKLRNERAFDAGRSLFDGELIGHPYRTVVKDFQVKTYREVCALHESLPARAASRVATLGCSTP